MTMFSIGLFAVKLFSTKYYLCKHWLFVGDKQESANRRIGLPNIAIVECAPKTQKTAELVSKVSSPDMIIVQNFTPPDLQAKSFTVFQSRLNNLSPGNISNLGAFFLVTNELIKKSQ